MKLITLIVGLFLVYCLIVKPDCVYFIALLFVGCCIVLLNNVLKPKTKQVFISLK